MATPFAEFANCRIAWLRPTAALTNLRDGTRPAATTTVVMEAFIEPAGDGQPENRGEATAQASQGRSLSGYLTRWATLPNGADWLDAGTSWTWDDSGLRPEGLTAGRDELQAALVSIADLPATDRAEIGTLVINQLGSPYGPGGIGQQVTAIAGEYLSGVFRIP